MHAERSSCFPNSSIKTLKHLMCCEVMFLKINEISVYDLSNSLNVTSVSFEFITVDAVLSCKSSGGAVSVPGTSTVPTDGSAATASSTLPGSSQPPTSSTGQLAAVSNSLHLIFTLVQ